MYNHVNTYCGGCKTTALPSIIAVVVELPCFVKLPCSFFQELMGKLPVLSVQYHDQCVNHKRGEKVQYHDQCVNHKREKEIFDAWKNLQISNMGAAIIPIAKSALCNGVEAKRCEPGKGAGSMRGVRDGPPSTGPSRFSAQPLRVRPPGIMR